MEWKTETLRSGLKMNKEKLIFLFCSGLLLFILSIPSDGGDMEEYAGSLGLSEDAMAAGEAVQTDGGTAQNIASDSVEEELELRVRQILSGVDGVGELEVMVFLKTPEETGFYQESSAANRSPEVSGIIISADGGGSAIVKTEISEAMEALFGLPSHKIKVLKRVKKES